MLGQPTAYLCMVTTELFLLQFRDALVIPPRLSDQRLVGLGEGRPQSHHSNVLEKRA